MIKEKRPRIFYGYVIIAISLLIQLIGLGTFHTYGIFFKELQLEFGWSRAVLSGAHSLCFSLGGFLSIVVGRLSDRFGPRFVMAICGFFFGLGILLMSQLNTVWQLYLFYGVVVGIGMSVFNVVPLSMVVRWFVKKRGIMSGIVKVGAGLGMLIMPAVASGLIPAFGWRSSYIILGVITLVSLISLAQFLRRDPAQMHLLPDGEEQTVADGSDSMGSGLSLREAIHIRQFWLLCAAYMTVLFCGLAIPVHIAPHAMDLGISVTKAAGVLSTIGGVSIIGRIVMGATSDKIGDKRTMIICFIMLLISLLWLQLAGELWSLYLFAVLYGFTHGGIFALISPTVAGLFGTRSHGVILGVVLFSGTLGGAIGAVLTGYIFDVTQSYRLAFWLLTVVITLGLILMAILKTTDVSGIVTGKEINPGF